MQATEHIAVKKKQVQIFCPENKPLIDNNRVFYPVTNFELTERERERARDELGESEEKIRDCLKELKKKLWHGQTEQSDNWTDTLFFPTESPTCDDYLLRYLRGRKYDCERAFKSVKQLDYFRKNRPDFFVVPHNPKELFALKGVSILPYSDEDGRVIYHAAAEKWKPDELSFEEAMGCVTYIYDVSTMNPRSQVNGVIGIFDMKGLNRNHCIEYLRKQRLQNLISLVQEAYPWRIKKVFLLNTGPLTRLVFSIVRPFLSKKVRHRFRLLGSELSELHEYINPAILPKVLGGQLEDVHEEIANEFFLRNLSYIKHLRLLD